MHGLILNYWQEIDVFRINCYPVHITLQKDKTKNNKNYSDLQKSG